VRLDFSVVFCGRRGRERRSAGREREREKRAGWEGFSSSPAFSLCSFVFLLPSEGEGESLVGRGGEGRVQCVTGVRVMFGFCVSFPVWREDLPERDLSAHEKAVHFFFFFFLTRPNSGRPFSLSPSPVPSLFIYTPCMPCFGISLQVRGPRDGGGVMPAGTRPPRGGGRCKKEGLLAASQFRNSQHPARGARTGRCRRCHASSLPGCLRQSAPP